MDNVQEERIDRYFDSFNQEENYILCHHISREMLLEGDNKPLAKCLATLSALMEQAEKRKWGGYQKLYSKFFDQLKELNTFPFDEEKLIEQIERMNEQVNRNPDTRFDPIVLMKSHHK